MERDGDLVCGGIKVEGGDLVCGGIKGEGGDLVCGGSREREETWCKSDGTEV